MTLIVTTTSGLVLHLQDCHIDTAGNRQRAHAGVRPPLDLAMQFETLVRRSIDAVWTIDDNPFSDPRQTALPAFGQRNHHSSASPEEGGIMAQTHLAYLDPPADVQPAVAAVKQACAGWHKTEVSDVEHPRLSSDVAVPHALTEAQICSFIADPSQGFWAGSTSR